MGWLCRITTNMCKDWLRSRSRRPDREFVEDLDPEILDRPSMDFYRENTLYGSIQEALDSLPELYSQVLTLRYFGGMTVKEMARFLGVSPGTIDRRLREALIRLKQEVPATMSATYERHELPDTFTFRIVEKVKSIRIHPVPRTAGLPWGLSVATGIIFTALCFNPQPSMFDRFAIGSPAPAAKHTDNREMPVDVLEAPQLSILAGSQGDGDSLEPEHPGPQSASFAAAGDSGEEWIEGSASGKGDVVDPETGMKYTKTRAFSGNRDVITWDTWGLNLSPNGKFLLWNKTVIPLDDGEPFDLVDMPAESGIWSPDGEKVILYSKGAVWLLPVSPETGRSAGSVRELMGGWHVRGCWSPDSERIVFERWDEEVSGTIWTLSTRDGTLTQITDHPAREYRPVWSPNGEHIAYNWGRELQVTPAEGGTSRRICSKGCPIPLSWSPDSEWLVYSLDGGLRFFRLADGREVDMTPPPEAVGKADNHFGWSSDGKMLFYRPSYNRRAGLKAVSASGGAPRELGRQLNRWWQYTQSWSPDSTMVATTGEDNDGNGGYWIIPLAGGDPFLLKLDVSVAGKPRPLYLSPDCGKLAFVVPRSDGKEDLYVVPVSLEDGRTTGQAVMVLSGWDQRFGHSITFSWSPDGSEIALVHKWKMWIAFADGRDPREIKDDPRGHRVYPVWSPDGEMLSYKTYYTEKEQFFRVIRASGSYDTVVLDIPDASAHEWSSDSRDLLSFSEGAISAISVSDGKTHRLLDLGELSIDNAWEFSWSPDGQTLAFIGYRKATASYHIFTVPAGGGKFIELAAGDPGEKWFLYWSPDGKWLSYDSYGYVKVRPEGAIWEADVSGLLSAGVKEN
jgi:Tol biopolymer transport system component